MVARREKHTGDHDDTMESKKELELLDAQISAIEPLRRGVPGPSEPVDAEEGVDLRACWSVLRKRRWTILSVVTAIFTITLVGTLRQTPVYRAQTMIEVEKQNPTIPSIQDLFQLENVSDTYLETQYKIFKSESLATRIVDSLHLERMPELNPAAAAAPGSAVGAAGPADALTRQAVVARFRDRLRVQPIARSRLVMVSFDSRDPKLATEVVNSLASNYIQGSLDAHWEAMENARGWLSQQLQDVKVKLERSEDELQQYARFNGLMFLESDKGSSENIVNEGLRKLQDELIRAQADRYEKESVYRLLQVGDASALRAAVDNTLLQSLGLRLSELDTERARLATTYSDDYPKVVQVQNQIDQVTKTMATERMRIANRIANDYAAAVRREDLVDQALLERQKQASEVATKAVQYNILKREVDTNKQLYEGLLTRLKEAGVSAGLTAGTIRTVDPAVAPTSPVSPRIFLNLSLALALGLCSAVGVAFLQEHLDNTLKTPEDVERTLHLPALALIPAFRATNGHRQIANGLPGARKRLANGRGRAAKPAAWYRVDDVGPQFAGLREAFRDLRTSVLLSTPGRAPRSLLITSAQPGEGKTTVSVNLAISLAQLGQRVLLVDGDLRRPSIHKAFQIDPGPGLVSYLTGHRGWASVVLPTAVAGLDVLPCGPVPPNPAELLFSEHARTMLREAAERYQMVILDSAPLLNVADSRVLSVMVDGVVIVVRGHVTPYGLVQRVKAHVSDTGANLIGVVLNSIDFQQMDYYSYGYSRKDAYAVDPQVKQSEV